jgi:hypothetical protein
VSDPVHIEQVSHFVKYASTRLCICVMKLAVSGFPKTAFSLLNLSFQMAATSPA